MPPEDPAPSADDAEATEATPGRRQTLLAYLRRLARPTALHLVGAVLVAVLAESLLEVARTGWNWAYLFNFAERDLGLMATSATILLLVILVLTALTSRLWVAATVVLSLVTMVGVASHLKFALRREPLYPSDLSFMLQPRFLLSMVDPAVVWWTLAALVALGAVTWGLSRLVRWRRGTPADLSLPHWRTTTVLARLVVAGTCLLLLAPLLSFNKGGNLWRDAYNAAGADWRTASQPVNYAVNGFLGGFLYNLHYPAITRPPGYSRAAVERVMEKYTALAEQKYGDRAPGALKDVNVVSVLSETLSDPTRLAGVRLESDPISRTRELMETMPHGNMLSPRIGGGTSSVEFEALTGMSLSQFSSTLDSPYQMLIPKYRHFPSAVEMFNQMGHDTVAIHPFLPTFYQRETVYRVLGFDDFIDMSEMRHHRRIQHNSLTADSAAFMETLDTLESHSDPVFVNLVTMQNHGPYDGKYDDPLEVYGLTDDDEMLGQYARGLTYTDHAIATFLNAIKHSDEKTIVVLYGDHQPGGLPEEVFERTPDRTLHETPFLVYANFGKLQHEVLPTTSPIFFMNHVFDLAGAPLTPYLTLLRELESHVPALEHGRLISAENLEISPDELSPEARQVLADYRLVQYDLTVGKRYAETMLYPAPAEQVAAAGTAERTVSRGGITRDSATG